MDNHLSMDDLRRKRYSAIAAAGKAADMHPEAYRAVRDTARHVATCTVDISRYEQTARRLADNLGILVQAAPGSIFSYFLDHIDPRRSGTPGFFRTVCADLDEQIGHIEQFRAGGDKHPLIMPERFRKKDDSGEPLP